MSQTRDDIRGRLKASDIIDALEGPLTQDDINEIRECEGDHHTWNYPKAVDFMLNKLLQLRDVVWYPTFFEAIIDLGIVVEVLRHANENLCRHPAFTSLRRRNEQAITGKLTFFYQKVHDCPRVKYFVLTCIDILVKTRAL